MSDIDLTSPVSRLSSSGVGVQFKEDSEDVHLVSVLSTKIEPGAVIRWRSSDPPWINDLEPESQAAWGEGSPHDHAVAVLVTQIVECLLVDDCSGARLTVEPNATVTVESSQKAEKIPTTMMEDHGHTFSSPVSGNSFPRDHSPS